MTGHFLQELESLNSTQDVEYSNVCLHL